MEAHSWPRQERESRAILLRRLRGYGRRPSIRWRCLFRMLPHKMQRQNFSRATSTTGETTMSQKITCTACGNDTFTNLGRCAECDSLGQFNFEEMAGFILESPEFRRAPTPGEAMEGERKICKHRNFEDVCDYCLESAPLDGETPETDATCTKCGLHRDNHPTFCPHGESAGLRTTITDIERLAATENPSTDSWGRGATHVAQMARPLIAALRSSQARKEPT